MKLNFTDMLSQTFTHVKFKNSNEGPIGITKAHKSADSLQNISLAVFHNTITKI